MDVKNEAMAKIAAMVARPAYLGLASNPRTGLPDEASPQITVTYEPGDIESVWRWASGQSPASSALCAKLVALAEVAEARGNGEAIIDQRDRRPKGS